MGVRHAFLEFMDVLWEGLDSAPKGLLTFSCRKENAHVTLPFLAQNGVPAEPLQWQEAGRNVYYGLALRTPDIWEDEKQRAYRQGKNSECVLLPAAAIDIDVLNAEAHKGKRYPSSFEQAWEMVQRDHRGLPPTVIVHTGYGYHAYWCFDKPIDLTLQSALVMVRGHLRTWQTEYRNFIQTTEGCVVDSTPNIGRIWRPPGFFNLKKEQEPRLVFLAHNTGQYYDPETFFGGPVAASYATAGLAAGSIVEPLPKRPVEDLEKSILEIRKKLTYYNADDGDLERQAMVRKLGQQESIAEPGDRDNALYVTASVLMFISRLAHDLTDEELAHHLYGPVLKKWSREEGAELAYEDEIEKVIDKLSRARADAEEQIARQERAQQVGEDAIRDRLSALRKERGQESVPEHVVGQDLTALLIEKGKPDPDHLNLLRSGFKRRPSEKAIPLIIEFGNRYYCHSIDDGNNVDILNPKSYQTVNLIAHSILKKFPGVEVDYFDKDTKKKLPFKELFDEYGDSAERVVYSTYLQDSYYDPEYRSLYVACCPLKETRAEYDRDVDEWLRLLSGERYGHLARWIASIPLLEYPTCALYLSGPPGAGKTMLSSGLARLWGGDGTSYENSADYNALMFSCPLVVLDEGFASTRSKREEASARFRQLVGNTVHERRQKFEPACPVYGALRFMITANNRNVFNFYSENAAKEDVEAIAQRVLHVEAQREAVELLISRGGRSYTSDWVSSGRIARHALWLTQNMAPDTSQRFLVEGEISDISETMTNVGERADLIAEWMFCFIKNPHLSLRASDGSYWKHSVFGMDENGEPKLYVSVQGIVDHWKTYFGDRERPMSSGTVGRYLGRFSDGPIRKGSGSGDGPSNGQRIRYHEIRLTSLLPKAEQVGYDEEEILEIIQRTPLIFEKVNV